MAPDILEDVLVTLLLFSFLVSPIVVFCAVGCCLLGVGAAGNACASLCLHRLRRWLIPSRARAG